MILKKTRLPRSVRRAFECGNEPARIRTPIVVPRDQRYGRYDRATACEPRRRRKGPATFRRPGSLSTSEERSPRLSVNKLEAKIEAVIFEHALRIRRRPVAQWVGIPTLSKGLSSNPVEDTLNVCLCLPRGRKRESVSSEDSTKIR